MGRSSRRIRDGKEFDELQRVKHENQKLKKEISALRKQLVRIDYTRFQNLKELVDKQHKEELHLENSNKNERLKEKWRCHECGKGCLYIKIFDHPVKGVLYWRSCNLCDHKTAMKPYDKEKVEGPKEEEESQTVVEPIGFKKKSFKDRDKEKK